MPVTPLERTFCHIRGIGSKIEKRLWSEGLLTWEDLAEKAPLLFPKDGKRIAEECAASRAAFESKDWGRFSSLPAGETWRLFASAEGRIGFLDIETTSVSIPDAYITIIGLFADDTVYCFMNEYEDLDAPPPVTPGRYRIVIAPFHRFEEMFAGLERIVTFNGKTFDLPIIRNSFPYLEYDSVLHLDLKIALRSLGIRGGLKKLERIFGIERPTSLEGLNGRDAVNLWLRFRRRADREALARLIEYNVQDIVNLKPLTKWVLQRLLNKLPEDTEALF